MKHAKYIKGTHLDECIYKRWIRIRNAGCCPEWLDFDVFRAWAIETGCDYGLNIKRYDDSELYSPENCYWSYNRTKPNYKASEFCKRWNETVNRIRVYCGMVPFEVE